LRRLELGLILTVVGSNALASMALLKVRKIGDDGSQIGWPQLVVLSESAA